MSNLEENIRQVRVRVDQAVARSAEPDRPVSIIGVTKTVDLDAVDAAIHAGLFDFGENRVGELVRKQAAFPMARWHMIGRLQTNKVKEAVEKAWLIHSLDRWNLAEAINRRGEQDGRTVSALLQVNVSGEASKAGLALEDVFHFLDSVGELKKLNILGLMTIAPEEDAEITRPVFKELKKIFDENKGKWHSNVEMLYLSMGMSGDFEVALEEGSNIVRIGRALFGS